MKTTIRYGGAAAVAAVVAVAAMAPASLAQGGGQGQGQRDRQRPLMGLIQEVTPAQLVIRMFGRPGGGPGGGRPQQGGQGEAVTVNVKLTEATRYGEAKPGTAETVEQGELLAAAKMGEGDAARILGVVTYRPANEEEARQVAPVLQMAVMQAARQVAGQGGPGGQGERPVVSVGLVTSTNPLKIRTPDGEVALAVAENARYIDLEQIEHDSLAVGRLAMVVRTPDSTREAPTAAAVVQLPPMQRGNRGGNPPAQ